MLTAVEFLPGGSGR